MYDDYYDGYFRNVPENGYIPDYRSMYAMIPQDLYGEDTYMQGCMVDQQMAEEDLEECYPEIYKIVYPMVKKACFQNTKPVSKKLIDDIVNDIYFRVEANDSININVNVGNTTKVNGVSAEREIKSLNSRPEVKSDVRDLRGELKHKETRKNNFLLNDLIKILVLRELINKPNRPGNRPPFRPPMRPPYPGPGPMGRPPMPRGFDVY